MDVPILVNIGMAKSIKENIYMTHLPEPSVSAINIQPRVSEYELGLRIVWTNIFKTQVHVIVKTQNTGQCYSKNTQNTIQCYSKNTQNTIQCYSKTHRTQFNVIVKTQNTIQCYSKNTGHRSMS